MRYPGFSEIAPGSVCHAFTTAMDILPTFLDLAGTQHPAADLTDQRATASFHDRHVYPMRGKSWVPYLRDGKAADFSVKDANTPEAIYGGQDAVVAWEHYGKAALRAGRWKIVNMPVEHPTGTGTWQLYDMYTDQGETVDLALQYPEKVTELLVQWATWLRDTGTHYTTPLKSADE